MTERYKVVRTSNFDDPTYVEKALSLSCHEFNDVWLMSKVDAEFLADDLNEAHIDPSGPHFWRAKPASYRLHRGMEDLV